MLTREVIKFALYHGCGKIQIENLTSLRQRDLKSEFRRLMWVPSKFKELLAYKADLEGIEVVEVNPRNTSRRCSICGHIDKDNRKTQRDFVCLKCGEKMNADYNAAKNIAFATGDVIGNGYIVASDDA
jgi:putative transposase